MSGVGEAQGWLKKKAKKIASCFCSLAMNADFKLIPLQSLEAF